ncbi:MAG: Uma2 family endonuclease, partial [Aquificota bacterium]
CGEVGLVLKREPLTLRGVDIAYISRDRLRELPEGVLETPPELVIEILSPSNTYTEMEEKVQELLDFGVDRVLLVDPRLKKAFLHKKGIVEVYSFDEEFELLPELKIKLSEVLEE